MTTLDAFFHTLRQTPDDWLCRAALADWFEEAGLDHTAACVRWMVRHGRRPSLNAAGHAFWFDADAPLPYTEAMAYLPPELYRALRARQLPHYCCTYADLRDAEEDLYAAWAAVHEAGSWESD
jgi:uncharacterized protein (TIGR02996 family)